MSTQEFVLGPYLVKESDARQLNNNVTNTGIQLEFVTPEDIYHLPIYRCIAYEGWSPDFNTIFVREDDLPFETLCCNFQVKTYQAVSYVEISAFLAELYGRFSRLIAIEEFLTALFDYLPVVRSFDPPVDATLYPLARSLSEEGYLVSDAHPYGRRILVNLGWLFPQARENRTKSYLNIGGIDFRPKANQTLNSGKWIAPRPSQIENLLHTKLIKLVSANPIFLFQDEAVARMLSEFDWTPLTLMTGREARLARIHFLQTHAEIVPDPKRLAEALQKAGLYAPNTSLHQICKSLPKLIKAAVVFKH